MVVWFAHVRVGHRQLPIPKSPLSNLNGGFFYVWVFNWLAILFALIIWLIYWLMTLNIYRTVQKAK